MTWHKEIINEPDRHCIQCEKSWPADTSMRLLRSDDEPVRIEGPFCPGTDCADIYKRDHPDWSLIRRLEQ